MRAEGDIVICGWMRRKLHLSGTELLTFAAICGNVNGISFEHAPYEEISDGLGISRTSFYRAREKLLKKGLISYEEDPSGVRIKVTEKALRAACEESENKPDRKTRGKTKGGNKSDER